MEGTDYILTVRHSPEGAKATVEFLGNWEGIQHIATVPQDEFTVLVIWQVPNPTVACGVVLTSGSWYDDLSWGDYRVIPNAVIG